MGSSSSSTTTKQTRKQFSAVNKSEIEAEGDVVAPQVTGVQQGDDGEVIVSAVRNEQPVDEDVLGQIVEGGEQAIDQLQQQQQQLLGQVQKQQRSLIESVSRISEDAAGASSEQGRLFRQAIEPASTLAGIGILTWGATKLFSNRARKRVS